MLPTAFTERASVSLMVSVSRGALCHESPAPSIECARESTVAYKEQQSTRHLDELLHHRGISPELLAPWLSADVRIAILKVLSNLLRSTLVHEANQVPTSPRLRATSVTPMEKDIFAASLPADAQTHEDSLEILNLLAELLRKPEVTLDVKVASVRGLAAFAEGRLDEFFVFSAADHEAWRLTMMASCGAVTSLCDLCRKGVPVVLRHEMAVAIGNAAGVGCDPAHAT